MSKNQKSKVINIADLSNQESDLLAKLAKIKEQKEAVAADQMKQVGAVIQSFPSQISKILGRDITLAEAFDFVRREVKGNLGSLVNASTGSSENRGRRLNDDERIQLRQAMLDRNLAVKAGKPAEQLSAIAVRFNTTVQTAGKHAPSAAEIAAGKLSAEVPAPAETPVAPAPATA